MEEGGLGNLTMWSHATTTPLNSQVVYETNLAFFANCVLYHGETSTSREQQPWPSLQKKHTLAVTPKACWLTSVNIKYPALMQSSCVVKRRYYLELYHLYHSHPSVVKLWPCISSTGRTYLSSGTFFPQLSSFSVAVNKKVNMLAVLSRICVVSCAVDHVIRFPGLLPPFLQTASNQKLGHYAMLLCWWR